MRKIDDIYPHESRSDAGHSSSSEDHVDVVDDDDEEDDHDYDDDEEEEEEDDDDDVSLRPSSRDRYRPSPKIRLSNMLDLDEDSDNSRRKPQRIVRYHNDRKWTSGPDHSLNRIGPTTVTKTTVTKGDRPRSPDSRRVSSSRKSDSLSQSFAVGSDDFARRFSSKAINSHRERLDGSVHIALAFETDCAWFVKEELDGSFSSLMSMVVLTSTEEQHRAMTVGEYIAQMWPASEHSITFVIGQLVSGRVETPSENAAALTIAYKNRGLIAAKPSEKTALSKYSDEVVSQLKAKEAHKELALSSETSVTSVLPAMNDAVISINWPVRSKIQTLIHLSGSDWRLAQLIEALAWLFTTLGFQSNPSGRRVLVDLVRETGVNNLFLLRQVENPYLPSVGQCWYPILPHTPCIMSRWPASSDADMSGLLLNFELLCFLCGLSYETLYDGGVVLYGEYGMAYPVFAQSNGVQWHFEPCSLDENHHNSLAGSRRLRWDDLEKIRGYENHYVGLWEQAEITLGTGAFDYTTLKYSKAKEVRKETTRDGHSFGGSIALPKAFTLHYTRTYKVARSQKTMFTRSFMENLHAKINTPVILYSPSEERAWMVSYVSVLLHLARNRVHHQRSLGYVIPPCDARGDGGQAAFDCILSCYKDPVKQAIDDEILSDVEKSRTIGDYLNDISAAMTEVRRHSSLAKGIFYNKIFGSELNDIARFKEETTLRQWKLDVLANGWGPLLREIKYVFFCEGLADPIRPSVKQLAKHGRSGPCGRSTWASVPRNHNLLTASAPCLFDLAERNLEADDSIWQLISEYYWHRPPNTSIFEMCNKASNHTCDRLQELASSRSASKPPGLVRERCETGAVVFKYVESMTEIEYLQQTRDRSSKSTTTQELVKYDWPESRSSSAIPISPDTATRTPSSSTSFKNSSGSISLKEMSNELDPEILHHPDCPCRACKAKPKAVTKQQQRPPSPSSSPPPPPRRNRRNRDVDRASRETIPVDKTEPSHRTESSPKIESSRNTESPDRRHTRRRTRTSTHRRSKNEARSKEEEQSAWSRIFSTK